MMKKIVIYTGRRCPYCEAAKRLLESSNIRYEEVPVNDDRTKDEMIARSNGRRTFPQIFFDSENIGGYEELKERSDRGSLLKDVGIED